MIDRIPDVLACDVGNGAIHFAHVNGEKSGPVHRLRHGDLAGLGEEMAILWDTIPTPRKLVACSVNPAGLRALEASAQDAIGQETLVVGRDLPLPIDVAVEHPGSIGADRICNAVAAFDQLGVPCVVADFGTAVTIDCVDAKGVLLGGAILPGLAMGAEALAARTALLPAEKLTQPDWVFGQDTHQAIVGGLVFGARGALRAIVESYAEQLGQWPVVILTGGDAELICPHVDESDIVQAVVGELTLRGVALAYYRTLLK